MLRTGERARRVFLNPSKKFSLLFVGLGVRGGPSPSKPPVCDRCTGCVLRCVLLSLFAAPDIVSIGGTETAARITGSGVVPRLYASKLKMNCKHSTTDQISFFLYLFSLSFQWFRNLLFRLFFSFSFSLSLVEIEITDFEKAVSMIFID